MLLKKMNTFHDVIEELFGLIIGNEFHILK